MCGICGQPYAPAGGGQPTVTTMGPHRGVQEPGSPPPPAPESRLAWAGPPPEIHQPPINPAAADDPWASWYGKPKSARRDSPSETLPRVPPGMTPGPPQGPGQYSPGQYGGGPAQFGPSQQYGATEVYAPSPQYGNGPQNMGPQGPGSYGASQYGGGQYGDEFGGPQQGPGQYNATQQLSPGQPYGPGGTAFGGGAYSGPGSPGGPGAPMPYGDQGYADQGYAEQWGDQPYGPGPGQPYGPGGLRPGGRGLAGLRGRGPLVPALAIGAVAVVAVVALVLANSSSGGSPNATAATSGTATGPAASASATSDAAEAAAARQLSPLLGQAGKYFTDVNAAVGYVGECKRLSFARTAFSNSASNRQNLLNQVNALPGKSALPADLLADLTGAWQASIAADRDLHAWALDESHGCQKDKTTQDPNYQASLQYDSPATSGKQEFAKGWAPIARKYGLTVYNWTQL